jgi:hypothetical protein
MKEERLAEMNDNEFQGIIDRSIGYIDRAANGEVEPPMDVF